MADKTNITELINQSLRISVAKKSIFDVSLKILSRKKVEVESSILVDIVNDIPLQVFRNLLRQSENERDYLMELKEIIKSVVKQYISKRL